MVRYHQSELILYDLSMESKDKSSYRGIFKATSLFGGVQVYQIIIEIIKSKFIAVLLGPAGMGISGLYNSGTQMIQQLSSLGLSTSAVRNVAEAYGTGNIETINKTATALRRLVWLTGIAGMIAVVIFSPMLSRSSFGDDMHIWGFVALSVVILFTQLANGQRVILQGTRQYKYLAKSTAYGVTIGLFVTVPLYFVWGIDAIVPNIIIGYFISLLLSWHYSKKVPFENVIQTYRETFMIGKTMLVMGITMSLTGFLPLASSYVLRSYIRMVGGIEQVGLFAAGFTLMTQYTNLVFSAMSTDFYPRLAAVNRDNIRCKEIMNQQGEIGMLLIGPLMVLCILFIPIVVRILYSDTFMGVNDYIVWCAMGMIFKMGSWTVSHIILAKAESKLFAINETSVCIYGLGLDLLCYQLWGLTGLGISFSLKYFLYMIQVFLIARHKYDFSFSMPFVRLFVIELAAVVITLALVYSFNSYWRYIFGTIVALVFIAFSFIELDKRMGIKGALTKIIKR